MNIYIYIYYFILQYVWSSAANREDMHQTFVQFKNSLQLNFHVIKISQHMQNILRKFSI